MDDIFFFANCLCTHSLVLKTNNCRMIKLIGSHTGALCPVQVHVQVQSYLLSQKCPVCSRYAIVILILFIVTIHGLKFSNSSQLVIGVIIPSSIHVYCSSLYFCSVMMELMWSDMAWWYESKAALRFGYTNPTPSIIYMSYSIYSIWVHIRSLDIFRGRICKMAII